MNCVLGLFVKVSVRLSPALKYFYTTECPSGEWGRQKEGKPCSRVRGGS